MHRGVLCLTLLNRPDRFICVTGKGGRFFIISFNGAASAKRFLNDFCFAATSCKLYARKRKTRKDEGVINGKLIAVTVAVGGNDKTQASIIATHSDSFQRRGYILSLVGFSN